MERKPIGKVVKKDGKFVIEGDTSTKNREYYEEKIAEAEEEDNELNHSLKTWTSRVNEAKEDDPELPRMMARLEHLRDMSSKRKKIKLDE